jgi:DNA helicase-2/ATP-dependent DNA helicase PcrA
LEDYLSKLNEQQRAAVEYCDGPSLVIAGAGSGKTRVLTYKIVHLLNLGYKPYQLMALTFTNKAAREMRERIEALVGHDIASQLWMGTFHSIFARILRINAERIGYRHDFTIYDQSDSKSLIKLIVRDLGLDDKLYKPATLQSYISNLKNALISPDDYENNRELIEADNRAKRPLMKNIYRTYWERCRVAEAMDFDDLLFNMNILLRDCPDVRQKYQEFFRYILVDEYQDTNFAQHMIVLQLTQANNKLCVVGDDAQSIYSFRGASIDNILNLKKSFPGLKTFKLERNYRSTQNIINAANSLIEKNQQQIRKHIFSENDMGSRIKVIECYSDFEEAFVVANQIVSMKARQGCSYEDFAVLYRTNAQSRRIEEALSSGGRRNDHGNVRRAIPYRIYGGLSFYQRKEIKDAISYFRLAVNPDDDEALRRIINYPTRGIGESTLQKVQHCAIQNNASLWQVIKNADNYQLNVNKGTLSKLQSFATLIDGFINLNREGHDAYFLAHRIINDTKLLAILLTDNSPENISRQENLNELLAGVSDFVSERREEGNDYIAMSDYLADISLVTDLDNDDSNMGECVTLMTVHAAKGLEFDNVIIVGAEEDLFPSSMSRDSHKAIEEERRLMYVAITRAKSNCIITYARSRFKNGKTNDTTPSRFLTDIDPQFLSASTTSAAGGTESLATRNRRSHIEQEAIFEAPKPSTTSIWQPLRHEPKREIAQAPVAAGNASTHNVDELSEGCRINHTRFGGGEVLSIDKSGDPKIIVKFDNAGVKTLLLKFAKFNIES